jgi:hypothetical protein
MEPRSCPISSPESTVTVTSTSPAASRSATFQPKRRLAIDARTAGCEWTGAMDYDDTGWLLMQAAQKAVVSGDDCGC